MVIRSTPKGTLPKWPGSAPGTAGTARSTGATGSAGAGATTSVAAPQKAGPAGDVDRAPASVPPELPPLPSGVSRDPTPVGNVAAGTTPLGLRLSAGKHIAPAFGTAAFERVLDERTRSVARPDNRVSLLLDGHNSFAERDRLIDGAKHSIHLQTFIFTDDDTGWDLARRLAAKAKEGVQVRVLYDAMGSLRAGEEIFELMKQAGVEVRAYAPPLEDPLSLNARWHEKHLIVDGEVSIEGGMNIADEYRLGGSGKLVFSRGEIGSEPWRDVDMKLEGPAVHDAQRAFLRNWAELGPPVPDEERASLFPPPTVEPPGPKVRVVQHRPHQDGGENTNELYLQCIRSARKSITIENAYFLPPEEIREELKRAAARGVDVRIMTNSYESNDIGFVSEAARYFYDELLAAGVKIYEKQGGTLHSKTASFDGEYSIVGSCNLNGRSKGRDSECVLSTDDPRIARELEQRFDSGLEQTKEVTLAELEGEGFFADLRQWALSTLAWTF